MNTADAHRNSPPLEEQYAALTEQVGWVDLSQRTRIRISGADHVRFLHGFCTGDIQKLTTGGGCEALLLDVKGRLLGHVFIFRQDDALLLETSAGQAERIITHLDRYVITDDVGFQDLANTHAEFLLAGDKAPAVLQTLFDQTPPAENLSGNNCSSAGLDIFVLKTPLAGENCFQLLCPAEQAAALRELLTGAGAQQCDAQQCDATVLDCLRIEAGIPEYGVDISDENLPQEIGRDTQAISFTKGCYLGQETVARIDALGHVNKQLVGLNFDLSQPPPAGTTLFADAAEVGAVTSAAYSPRCNGVVALAMVRSSHCQPGRQLTAENGAAKIGTAKIVSLPMR